MLRHWLLSTLLLIVSIARVWAGDDRAAVLAEILPASGPAWPPYQVAAHAVRLTPGTAGAMAAEAVARQDRLTVLRLAQRAITPVIADDIAREVLLAYAFGETSATDAGTAVEALAPTWRLGLARLLLADANVDQALALARPLLIAGPGNAVARAAAHLIAEVVRDRAALARVLSCPLLPLLHDPQPTLTALFQDPAWATWLMTLAPALPVGEPANPLAITTAVLAEWENNRQQHYQERIVDWDAASTKSGGVTVGLRLDTAVPDFHLHRRDSDWPRRGSAVIDCRTRYHGAITFALHRCADHVAWERLDPELVTGPALRTWRETFVPLADCNRRDAVTGSTRIDGLEPGWYVVTARARGAPVVAAQRLAVSTIQLTIIADHERAVVVAIERGSGRPLPGVEIAVASAVDGVQHSALRVTTGDDGSVEAALSPRGDPQRPLLVSARLVADAHLSATDTTVPAIVAPTPVMQAALWSAIGTVAPGAVAQIAGVVRVRTGTLSRVPLAGEELPRLILRREQEVVLSTVITPDAHGRFAWSTTVPPDWKPGRYSAHCAEATISAFTVSAADLPAFVLLVGTDRAHRWNTYVGGETAHLSIRAAAWNQLPVPGVTVSVRGLPAGVSAPVSVITAADGTCDIPLHIPIGATPGSLTATVAALAPDGARVEANASCTITTQPFRMGTDGDRDPTVATPAVVRVFVTTWSDRPLRGAVVRIAAGAEETTGEQGSLELPLPTTIEGPRTVSLLATAAGGSVSASWSYTVRPARRQQLERPADPQVPLVRATDPQTAPENEPAPVTLLDEFRPFVRSSSLRLTPASQSTWTPWTPYVGHYALADGAPATIDFRASARDDRPALATALMWASGTTLLAHRVVTVAAQDRSLTLPLERSWAPQATVAMRVLDGDQQVTTRDVVHALTPESVLKITVEGAPDFVRPGERLTLGLHVADGNGRIRPGCAVICRIVDLADEANRHRRWQDGPWYQALLPWAGSGEGLPAGTDSAYPVTDGLRWWTMGLPTWTWSDDMRAGISSEIRMGLARHAALRSDWRRLALWRTDLITGADGRVSLDVTIPDRLTTWCLNAWAVADDGALGDVMTETVSRLPAAGTLPVPAFVRAGDRIALRPGVSRWGGGVARASLGLEVRTADGPVLAAMRQDATPTTATRAAQITVPASGILRCVLGTSVAGVEVDRLLSDVPILPAGERQVRWQTITVARTTTIDPATLIDNGGPAQSIRVTLDLERGTPQVLAAAVDALLTHPHGCVEQTLSRFLPAVLAARAAGDAPGSGFDRTRITATAASGIARLIQLQRADGGWGWFGGDTVHPALTALAVEGLAAARDAGLPVPPSVLRAGTAWLAHLDAKTSCSAIVGAVDLRLLATLARVAADGPGSWLNAERPQLQRLVSGATPLRDRCLAARLLVAAGDATAAQTALPELLRACRPRRGERESLLAAAEVLILSAAIDRDEKTCAALARDLLAARANDGDGTSWGDTYVTALVVRALVLQPLVRRAAPVQVLVERLGQGAVTLTADQPRLDWTAADAAVGKAPIRLTTTGSTTCRLRVEWVGPARQRVGADTARIALDLPGRRAAAPFTATRGEAVTMTWVVRVARDVDHACLSIPLPAGVTVLDGKCPGAVSTGMIADGWCAYLTRLPAGEHRVVLRVVAAFSGDLACPPPRLWPMYGDDPGTITTTPARWIVGE